MRELIMNHPFFSMLDGLFKAELERARGPVDIEAARREYEGIKHSPVVLPGDGQRLEYLEQLLGVVRT